MISLCPYHAYEGRQALVTIQIDKDGLVIRVDKVKKDNEVFHDVLQVYHKDSVPTAGPRYPTDLQRILSNK